MEYGTTAGSLDLKPEYFGPLWEYVADDAVTDIDYNGRQLWITDCRNQRRRILQHQVTELFLEQFSQRIANLASRQFNKVNNLLEAETDTLRISIIHESAAVSGRSLSIRKSLPLVRIHPRDAVRDGYCSSAVLQLLANCVGAKLNLVFCGEPGAGKTECAKFFSGFIPAQERVITIEDNREWHYREIYPDKDCVELKVGPGFSYTKAIKSCLRQNPGWIMLSEARSVEVKYLLECWSSGVHGMTTLHTDDTRKVPDRILNMMESRLDADRLENDVYTFVDAAVLLLRRAKGRCIDQICFFDREDGRNIRKLVLFQGTLTGEAIPVNILARMERQGILKPYVCPQVQKILSGPPDAKTERGCLDV